jgi:TPR repeat protein
MAGISEACRRWTDELHEAQDENVQDAQDTRDIDEAQDRAGVARRSELRASRRSMELLAEQVHAAAAAQHELGCYHAHGKGLPADWAAAVRAWGQAAEQGHAGAQHQLGLSYAHGNGVAKDLAQAAHLWRQAADSGLSDAQFNLGFSYAHGQGVVQDWAEALRLWRQAANQGHPEAQANLGTPYMLRSAGSSSNCA